MRCCQYIMVDRDRFDDGGLTETGLSSGISNLFVSAVILTDKQSACNITSTLTECDSASTRHEKMAFLQWIGKKEKKNKQFKGTVGNLQKTDFGKFACLHFCTSL